MRGSVGRATDDAGSWLLLTEWESVGAYRRGLGGYQVKLHATPLLSQALDRPARSSSCCGSSGTGRRRRGPATGRPTPTGAPGSRTAVGSPRIAGKVEVVHRYSKHDLTGVGLDRLSATLAGGGGRRSETRNRPHRFKLDQRLDASLPAEVVADYEAGMPTTKLTGKYGLSKASVLRLLHEAEAEMRRQPFSDQEMDEVARLYASGLSTAAIGIQIGAHPSKVWRALRARGVALRPSRNRRPATS